MKTKNDMLQEKIKGLLIGGALGDAMGMPTECWSRQQIKERYPEGLTVLVESDCRDVLGRTMEAGAITDDTINTLMILEMLIEAKGKLDVNFYIRKLSEWNETSGLSEYVSGPSTLRALNKISKGIPVEKAGIEGTTNGAAMKISPLGIISDYRNPNELIENVYQICLPTHNTSIAISGACAVAAAVSYALNGGKDMEELWDLVLKYIEKSKEKGFDYPSASLLFRMEQARAIVQHNSLETALDKLYNEIGTGVETIETVPTVFAVVELAQGNPIEAAKISANLGGDTDTIGAISAGICGAMNPEFESTVIEQLEKVNNIDFERLANDILPYAYKFDAKV